jgi:hypothetical protein
MRRRVVVLVVGLLVLQAPVAQADPDVTVRCGGGIRARLVLDRPADRVRLRFILNGSDPWIRWTIWIHRAPGPMGGGHMVFHTSRTADGDGRFVVQRTFLRRRPLPLFGVMARDWQTDQECGAGVWGPEEQAVPAPDVVRPGWCSDGARSRLELTDIGDRIKVRFEVHDSPPGHLWHVRMWRIVGIEHHVEIWRGARVASASGDFSVGRLIWDITNPWGLLVKAVDSATGQRCRVRGRIRHH